MLVVQSSDGGAAAARHIKAQLGDLDSCVQPVSTVCVRNLSTPVAGMREYTPWLSRLRVLAPGLCIAAWSTVCVAQCAIGL